MESSPVERLYQNTQQLSLFGKIIVFNCKQSLTAKDRGSCELAFRSLLFERENNAFLKAADGAAVISKRSSHVILVTCKCVINVRTRLTTPCILVMKKSEKGLSFKYSLLSLNGSKHLEPCFEFKLPYQMRDNVSIMQGPTVLWSHAGHVFYTSVRTGEVRQIPVQLSHCITGYLPLHKEQIFVLGQQNLSELNSNNQTTNQSLLYLVESGHIFDGSMIMPHPYICITRCLLVLSAEKADGGDDGVLKSAVVAATSCQQLVYFEDGVVKDICQLPFEQPENIQMVNTGRNGCLFAISFNGGHVCAVWRETFQIAGDWSDVSWLHVDDFLSCGSDQMLLVFEDPDSSGQPLKRFLLTDLCGLSYACCQDDGSPMTTPPPPENYLLTLNALESRLQSGLNVLQELEREVNVKERLLELAVQALTDAVSETQTTLTHPEQEGLVTLWDSDDESKEEALNDKIQDVPAASSKPQVDKLWHRIIEDRMVVGVILTTDNSVPMASVSLSILTETGQSSTPAVIQSQSQVFWLPAPCSSSSSSSSSASTFPEPAAKRSKGHNDLNTCRLAVTAVTKLTPLLNSGCVKCCVMLHYIQRQDAFALMSSPTPAVKYCGPLSLDVHGDFQSRLLQTPQLKTDAAQEDLLSLMALLDHWVFLIDSPDHSLGDIEGWIQKRGGCKKVEVSPEYLLSDSAGSSTLMLLRWHQINPFQGELTVHSSQLQVLQFLDSLMANLPVTCSIQPVKGARGRDGVQMLSSALEKELVSLKECVSSLLCGEEEEEEKSLWKPQETSGPAGPEELQRGREQWQRDMERSRMRLSPLVDVGRYRQLNHGLSKVQLSGDLTTLLNTQSSTLIC